MTTKIETTQVVPRTTGEINRMKKAELMDELGELGVKFDAKDTVKILADRLIAHLQTTGEVIPEGADPFSEPVTEEESDEMDDLNLKAKGKGVQKFGFDNKKPVRKVMQLDELLSIMTSDTEKPWQTPGRGFDEEKAKEYAEYEYEYLGTGKDLTRDDPFVAAFITDRPDLDKPVVLDGNHRYNGFSRHQKLTMAHTVNVILYEATEQEARLELLRVNQKESIPRTEATLAAIMEEIFYNQADMLELSNARIAAFVGFKPSSVGKHLRRLSEESGRALPEWRRRLRNGEEQWFRTKSMGRPKAETKVEAKVETAEDVNAIDMSWQVGEPSSHDDPTGTSVVEPAEEISIDDSSLPGPDVYSEINVAVGEFVEGDEDEDVEPIDFDADSEEDGDDQFDKLDDAEEFQSSPLHMDYQEPGSVNKFTLTTGEVIVLSFDDGQVPVTFTVLEIMSALTKFEYVAAD